MDPALPVQLAEATHALYRAAVALESVRSSAGTELSLRCPFLADDGASVPGAGSGILPPTPPASDGTRGDAAEVSLALRHMEVPNPGCDEALMRTGRTTHSFDPGAAPEHPIRSDELLQRLAADLNDVVTNGAFEAGIVLHGALQRTTDPSAAEQIEEAVAILDETIRKTRSLLFDRGPARG